MSEVNALRIRKALASLSSLGLALALLWSLRTESLRGPEVVPFAMMVLMPVLAAAVIWSGRVGAQLLARGVWWSFLLFGALVCATTRPSSSDAEAVWLALPAAAALLLAGSSGLDARTGRFQPVAFRGTLVLALILAIADTASFSWFGALNATFEKHGGLLLMVVPMAAGVIGLLRLRTWGLLVSLACNVLVVVLSLTGVLELPRVLRILYVSSAALQLVVPIPMIVAIVRRRPPAPDGWRRTKRAVSTSVIVAIAALSVYCAFLRSTPLIDR
jgi:hypothetical protein